MSLLELLKALSCNEKASISIFNEDEKCLITFNAQGYESIENDVTIRKVKRIKIKDGITVSGNQQINILIEDIKPEEDSGADPDTGNG